MSKKRKTKTRAKAKATAPKRRRKGWLAPLVGGLLILAAAGYFFLAGKQPSQAQLQTAAANCPTERLRGGERRSALPSSLFVGRVRSAYATAKAIPAVVDQLYCYCRCRENMGHKSLLSCYADTHASACDVCIVEAEMAAQLTAKGACPSEIQQAIDKRFGQS
jgi:hypothetical protein